MKVSMRRLARRSYSQRWVANHPVHEQYRRARNDYSGAIRKAKAEHWEAWMEGLDERTVWDAGRLVKGEGTDGGRAKMPILVERDGRGRVTKEARTNEEKGAMLFAAFFPPQQDAAAAPQEAAYPAPAWTSAPITNAQVHRAIARLQPYKAARSDSPPNSVLLHMGHLLVPHLAPLFRATYTQQHYPANWARTETLVLRKPGRTDYSLPGSWRPIVLSHGFGKLLNSCVTEDLKSNCEMLRLLPDNHFGARPGRTTTDSLHLLTTTIKDAWRRKQVASVLYLDVKGAFPSVSIDRLIHDMRMLGIPEDVTDWLRRRLAERHTSLCFDDHVTASFAIFGGLDQGDPLSALCYIIYNSGLLRIPLGSRGVMLLFVDDVSLIAVATTFVETNRMLKDVMEKEGGVLDWAAEHNCEFGIEKFQKVDHWRGKLPTSAQPKDLVLSSHRIRSQASAKFLGVLVDRKLDWKEQGAAALRKAQAWVMQYGRLARVTKGALRVSMRRFWLGVAIPRILYAADVFLTPPSRRGDDPTAVSSGRAIIKKLASVQRRAALAVTGGLASTPTDVLNVLAGLTPLHLAVTRVRAQAALRLATLPPTNPLSKAAQHAAKRFVKRHATPLHYLMHDLLRRGVNPATLERIAATRRSNKWEAAHEVLVEETKEMAALADVTDEADVIVYADGSGLDGGVGAAAVLYRTADVSEEDGLNRRRRVRGGEAHFWLGSTDEHTVYEGESVGALLALELVRREPRGLRKATICIDNQPVLLASQSNRSVPGHHIMDEFHKLHDEVRLRHKDLRLCLRWTPGHVGVEGNEAADEEARKAAGGQGSPVGQLPRYLTRDLPVSKAAARQHIRAGINEEAQRVWETSLRYQRTIRLMPDIASRSLHRSLATLPRKHASIITQLVTGHVPLARHLHRIGKLDSPICPACHEHPETVEHFVMHCPTHQGARRVMLNPLLPHQRNLTHLLSTDELRLSLLNFVAATGRLRSVFGDVPQLEAVEQGGEDEDGSEVGARS